MEPLGIVALLGLLAGFLLGGVGFALAPNVGLSPVLAYSAGVAPEAGVVQPATRRRVLGSRLKLAGLLLTLAALLTLGIAMGQDPSPDGPPGFP
jgi:hypothetical protein